MRLLTATFCLLLFFHLKGQDTLYITFIGDVMQHGPQIKSAYNSESKSYDYSECFKYLRDEMSAADLTIANLETTLAGPPYKGYPLFSAPDAVAAGLKEAGVDILVTANNHTCDRRKAGIIRTIDVLDSLDIGHTGSFKNQVDKDSLSPLLIEKDGFRLALLNYTYGTNGMPIDQPTRVNLIDPDSVAADLAKAKTMEVDKIIVFVHWGSEYKHQPNEKQKNWAELFFNNGADIVIGAHPHVVQPMIFQKGDSTTDEQVLVYSLGNFVSNQRTAPRDGGAIVDLTLVKEDGITRVTGVSYRLTWVWLPILEGKRRYFVMPAEQYEKDRQIMDIWSHNKMKAYLKTARGVLDKENVNVPEIRSLQ